MQRASQCSTEKEWRAAKKAAILDSCRRRLEGKDTATVSSSHSAESYQGEKSAPHQIHPWGGEKTREQHQWPIKHRPQPGREKKTNRVMKTCIKSSRFKTRVLHASRIFPSHWLGAIATGLPLGPMQVRLCSREACCIRSSTRPIAGLRIWSSPRRMTSSPMDPIKPLL